MQDSFSILLVDDDPTVIGVLGTILQEFGRLRFATSGPDALRMARQSVPDLILLDLNLPKMGGREVLAEIKRHPSLRSIPVVVLTSSDAEQDISKSYQLGANCYVTKPVGLQAFQSIVRSVEGFWFTVVKLP